MTPDEIRDIRTRLRQTQEDFSRRIGVSIETVRRWEQGKGSPGPDNIARLRYAAADRSVRLIRLTESLHSTAAMFDDEYRAAIADGKPEDAERSMRLADHLRRLASTHETLGVDPVQVP